MLRPGEPCPYATCDGSGFIDDEETQSARPCRCRPERIAGRRGAVLSNVLPKKYQGVGFDRPPVPQIAEYAPAQMRDIRKFVRDLDANLNAGRGLWLFGGTGTGKTTLAMLVSKAALESGRSVAIYSLPKLLYEIRRTFDEDSPHTTRTLYDRLTEVDLLHIDDVGAERSSDWVFEQLYSIINARYEEERSIIITTNLSDRQKMVDQIQERTVSRLEEMCTVLPLLGRDGRESVGRSSVESI